MLKEIEEINRIRQQAQFKQARLAFAKLFCLHEFGDCRLCEFCMFEQKALDSITEREAKQIFQNFL